MMENQVEQAWYSKLRKKKVSSDEGGRKMILIIYMILGYWATGRTLYRDVVFVYDRGTFFMKRMIWGTLGGWIFIPWALISLLLGR